MEVGRPRGQVQRQQVDSEICRMIWTARKMIERLPARQMGGRNSSSSRSKLAKHRQRQKEMAYLGGGFYPKGKDFSNYTRTQIYVVSARNAYGTFKVKSHVHCICIYMRWTSIDVDFDVNARCVPTRTSRNHVLNHVNNYNFASGLNHSADEAQPLTICRFRFEGLHLEAFTLVQRGSER
ncbi:hypothetical protein EVAR_68236_1 [Eumeta japonica]|uniref:Uncharacterized protein n=1 Tax=Eumeta variegata TaxID=151549 RepID=A0A4C1ZNH1_EUMVA|nr:hypothetical protein EVAR_68236_1 [Eumeta japonica]